MAKRRKSRKHRPAKKSGGGDIKKLLILAGLGFGLYMVMKPKAAPMVATVDGKPAPLSIVTEADLQKWLNA